MRICMLETSPKGPIKLGNIDYRNNFKNHDQCDFYFVTHDEEHTAAVNFRKGKKWASNRNFLAEFASNMGDYDYFWFTDYDVEYRSQTHLSVVDQVIKDLEENTPAVMVCFDPKKQNIASQKNIYLAPNKNIPIRSALMTNNQMKIVHKSLINYFFPMPLRFGSIWDTCYYFAMLEIPFMGNVCMNYNVYGSGLISDTKSQGTNASLNKIFNEMKQIVKFPLANNHAETSIMYQIKSRMAKFNKNNRDIDYYDKKRISNFIDLEKLIKFRID